MQKYNTIRVSSPPVQTMTRLKALVRKLLTELEQSEQDLSEEIEKFDFYEEVRRFEIELITRALIHCQGHQGHAAGMLNLTPSTLNTKIKQYNIQINAFSRDDLHETDQTEFGIPRRLR